MTELMLGDTVTWRKGGDPRKNKTPGVLPLGIANCVILDFGHAENGRAAAMLLLPGGMDHLGPTAAYLSDLYVEAA